jgi:hypothetical protein
MEVTLIECKHCGGTGTCHEDNGNSCASCLKEAKVKKDSKVVQCQVCQGLGQAEPKTARLNNRLPFLIVVFVLFVFYCYTFVNIGNNAKFDQIFPLIGSLTTMIVTFYFSRK